MKFDVFQFIKKTGFLHIFFGNPNSYFFSLADLMPHVKVQAVETVEGCTHEVSAVQLNVGSLGFFVEVHALLLVL